MLNKKQSVHEVLQLLCRLFLLRYLIHHLPLHLLHQNQCLLFLQILDYYLPELRHFRLLQNHLNRKFLYYKQLHPLHQLLLLKDLK